MKIVQISSRVIVQSVNIFLLFTEIITYSCTYFNEKAHGFRLVRFANYFFIVTLVLSYSSAPERASKIPVKCNREYTEYPK